MSRRKVTKGFWNKKVIGGTTGALVLIAGTAFYLAMSKPSQEADVAPVYSTTSVVEGTLASSTLLSGTVKALSEQYVYYDASKGSNASVTVAVGDQVVVGQQLVQYDTTSAQAAYDEAVRNLNKVGREINTLTTYGVPKTTTAVDPLTGQSATTTPTEQENAEYNTQLQNLYDSYASAEAQVAKAQEALNETVILSDVEGTVVEIDNDIDPSAKESQTLVHVTSEGKLQVEGVLTEYDLANIKTGQMVKFKSKVYPDHEWTGKITYISNYPSQQSTASATGGNSTGASYPYKAEITSELGNLKQGFSVSVEVINDQKSLLVPLSALVKEGDKSYIWTFDKETKKVNKVEVTVGNADAVSQEIKAGLTPNQLVIATPDDTLKIGEVVKDTVPLTTEGEKSSER